MCIKGFVNRLSHDCHIDWSQKSIYKSFPPLTAGLHQVIVRIATIYLGELIVPPWLLVIGVSQKSLMIGGFPSKAWLALLEEETVPSAVFCGKRSAARHPRFRNLNFTVPVDVVRVKSYVNSLFNTINNWPSSSSSSSFISFCVRTNFKGYSKLLGEETSRNHQAYRRGHLRQSWDKRLTKPFTIFSVLRGQFR